MGQKLATVFRPYCKYRGPLIGTFSSFPLTLCVCGGCNDGSSLAQNYLPGREREREREKKWGKTVSARFSFIFVFPSF